MSEKKRSRFRKLMVDEFMAKHRSEIAESEDVISIRQLAKIPEATTLSWFWTPSPELDAWRQAIEESPGHRLIRELKRYWRVRLLGAAAKENNPAAYRQILEVLLLILDVEAPEGVFIPHRGSPGITGCTV